MVDVVWWFEMSTLDELSAVIEISSFSVVLGSDGGEAFMKMSLPLSCMSSAYVGIGLERPQSSIGLELRRKSLRRSQEVLPTLGLEGTSSPSEENPSLKTSISTS